MENTNNSFNTVKITQPKPIGEWKIGDMNYFISFALTKKPNWFRRKMAWLFFGLEWIDFETPHDVKPSKGIRRGVMKVIQPQKGRHRR